MRWLVLLSASGRACPAPTTHPRRGEACLAPPRGRGRNHAVGALVLLAALSSVCLAQGQEQADLEKALSAAGSSPLEYLRAIEKHLEQYPDTARRPELERAAVRAAIEARDDQRSIVYGERVLARQPDDLQILEQVTRALLATDSKEAWERALKYARRLRRAGPADAEGRRARRPGTRALRRGARQRQPGAAGRSAGVGPARI